MKQISLKATGVLEDLTHFKYAKSIIIFRPCYTGNSDSGTKSNFFGHGGISPCNHRDIVGQRKWDNPWNVSNVYLSHELLEEVQNQYTSVQLWYKPSRNPGYRKQKEKSGLVR